MKKYALVEWTNEADAGSYSVVNSDWILGYTPEMYLIEWREGQGKKKPPPGGWPMGEAKILQTSDKEAELKKALHDMTTLKAQSNLVVEGKRRRIPKKRLYESDDETDTDAARSSGDDKKRGKVKKTDQAEASSPATPKTVATKSPSTADETPSQSTQAQEQCELSQNNFPDSSSEREAEESTDDLLTDGHVTEMDNAEEGSEAEYPPEYELSELEKLRIEVRALRDEIMLLRHQVCKELPKVHAIALKALGTQTNQSSSNGHSSSEVGSKQVSIKPEGGRKPARHPPRRSFANKPHRRTLHARTKTVLKKEAEIFRQQVQLEKASGKATLSLTPVTSVKTPSGGSSASPSPTKRTAAKKSNQIEIHPGTGVFISQESWDKVKGLDQPTAFARRLLPYVFDLDTLLTSNLRGGKSTRDVTAEPRRPLDQNRVDAIYKCIISKFPEASYCDIGQSINGRLSSIRYREQKRQSRLEKKEH